MRLRWSALRWVTPLLALFLVLGLLFADVARERARENSPFQGGVVQSFTADPRVALWEVTAEWIGDRPWVGYGFGKLILHDQIAGALHDVTLTHAHNLFASQWLQLGAVGLAAFVALLAALAWRFVRFLRGPDDALALLGLIGISMLVGFIVKNLTDDFLFRSNAKEFWALTAMLLGYGVRMEQDRVRCLSSDAIGPTLPHRR